MSEWNVLVTVHYEGYRRARELLRQFGRVRKTDYYNVLTLQVADPGDFQERLAQLCRNVPEVMDSISRAAPAQQIFSFQSAEEFESNARAVVLDWVPKLAGKSFHVRLHRRGFKGRLKTPVEERFLDEALLSALEARGTPGRVGFDDPDQVIDIETLDNRAGLSLWSREDLERCPFLKIG